MSQPTYLGDGLYCEYDGCQFRIFTERHGCGVHEVFMDDYVIAAFLEFIQFKKNLHFKITPKLKEEE